METSNYSFMKTGSNLVEPVENLNQVEKSQLLSVMTIFMENSLFIAEKFVLYENRIEITDEDIILALKSQALDHTEIWDTIEIKNKLTILYEEIYQELNENNLNGETDNTRGDDEEKIINTGENVENKARKILKKMSEDDYKKIKEMTNRWSNWFPNDQESIMIKKAIDNTEEKFKRKT